MRWQDLKNNMVVETRNGWKFYVKTGIGMSRSVKDGLSLYLADSAGRVNKYPMSKASEFNNDMRFGEGGGAGFDIVKVFDCKGPVLHTCEGDLELLWQRSKCIEISDEEIDAISAGVDEMASSWGEYSCEIDCLKSLIDRYVNAE